MGRTKRHRNRRTNTKQESDFTPVYSLMKWLHSLDLKDLRMKVVELPESGRAVLSEKTIKPGEEIVALPLEAMVTMDIVRQSTITEIFNVNFQPTIAMALWLTYEKHLGQSSKYATYLKILPENFDCLFLCCQKEMDAMPAWIMKSIQSRLKEIREGFGNAQDHMAKRQCGHCDRNLSDIFGYDAYLWAYSCVNTRCVFSEDETLSEEGEKVNSDSIALAPFLDFFNHSNRASVEAELNRQRGVYILKTRDKFKKNDEIFINYGPHSNLTLLIEYGFIEHQDEEQDIVEFNIDEVIKAAKAIELHYGTISKLKYKFITYNSLHVKLFKSKSEFSWNCRGLLYVLVTRDDNLSELLSKTYSSTYSEIENQLIEKIQRKLIQFKENEFRSELAVMEVVQPCSRAFTLAKDLVKMYIRILNS